MMTFLPYPDFADSMRMLDRSRLGNQVYREGYILLNGGWHNHPCSKMWRGYERELCSYLFIGAIVMKERGWNRDEVCTKWGTYYINRWEDFPDTGSPLWLGDERVHASHRANLLRKNPEWYGQFGWIEEPRKGYFWPCS